MKREDELRLLERILHFVESGEKDLVQKEHRQPVESYLDPARFAAERALFLRVPVVVAASAELPSAGSFVTHDWSGRPLLIVRGEDGRVRTHLNVCRHRGTRLVGECPAAGEGQNETAGERGCKRAFVCRYHAWSYRSDGALDHVPDRDQFPGLDKDDERGLTQLPTAERHGLVWTILTPGAPLDVAGWLGSLDDDLAALELGSHTHFRPISLDKRLNWKLAIDVFLEAYHLKYAHPRTIYKYFFDNLGLFERFGRHMRNLFPKRSVTDLKLADRSVWKLREHSNILYTLFPGTFLLVQPDHITLFQTWPQSLDRTRICAVTLLPTGTGHDDRYWNKNVDILHGAIEEDYALGESIQAGLASGANHDLYFGRGEQSLSWFHTGLTRALG